MYEAPIESHTPEISHQNHQKQNKPPKKKRRRQDYSYWMAGPHNGARGEEALWKAVITQAMMDALSNSRNPEIQFHKYEAIRWLTEPNKDFITVCQFADMHPDCTRKKAKRAIANPIVWRAEAGKGKRYEERRAYRKRIKQLKKQRPAAVQPKVQETDKSGTVITGCWQSRNEP